jgi:S-adenosylmethionine decarboxylase
MGLGREIRRDYSGLNPEFLRDWKAVAGVLAGAAKEARATVLEVTGRVLGVDDDSPPGCTCVVLLNESHITGHSYSDKGILAVNVFTCGEKANPMEAIEYIFARLMGEGKPIVIFGDDTVRFSGH